MSVSSLPEWKQLLLERRRREEEERERREKEEEEKMASMPAWKRGIIQRRKAKLDGGCERERERDVYLLQVDVRSDGLSDTDSSVTVNLGSDLSLSPDTGQWMDGGHRSVSRVSAETIVPLHENPFIRTQSTWRKSRDGDDPEVQGKDKVIAWGPDVEAGRGQDLELKIAKVRDLSEGWNQTRGRLNSREKVRNYEEGKETDSPSGSSSGSPLVSRLRTIRAENIIIIEQDKKGVEKKRGSFRSFDREGLEEDHHVNRGMTMDLRDILGGGSNLVTEIRASEVLIIKPSLSSDEKDTRGKGTEDGEMKSVEARKESSNGRERRTDMSWQRDKDRDQSWVQEDQDDLVDDVFVERGGRVSQLLSRFGERPRMPSRSKSSENFLQHGMRKSPGDEQNNHHGDERNYLLKSVPKRSFSFSDRVVCAKENGLDDRRRTIERVHSDRRVGAWVEVRRETPGRVKHGCARLLEKDRFAKHRYGVFKSEDTESLPRSQDGYDVRKVEHIDTKDCEESGDGGSDEGFMVASVKNTQGFSFAKRVSIRQEAKVRAEKDAKRMAGEKGLEREPNLGKDAEKGVQTEVHVRGDGFEGVSSTKPSQNYGTASLRDTINPCLAPESPYRHKSAFTECSSLLSTVADRAKDSILRPEWSGPCSGHTILSQHTEELLSKIEKIGETSGHSNTRGDRVYENAHKLSKECTNDVGSPKSPQKITPPAPLEIQIPRTVFYVAEEMVDSKKAVGQSDGSQAWDGGKGVQRRDSWRVGKPLSRIESLREKIRQKELEMLKQIERLDGEAEEIGDLQTSGERFEEREAEMEEEWEAASHTRKKLSEADTPQTEAAAFDVTQEVLKACPQLPVSAAHSQAVSGEEVSSGYSTTTAGLVVEVISDNSETSEDEDDLLKHDEEELRGHESQQDSGEEEEEEEKEQDEEIRVSSEEEEEEYISAFEPVQPSPSPPHPDSLAAMSRIYNLETVGSRSGLCLRDRTVNISPVHLVKVTPRLSNAQQGDSKTSSGEEMCGVSTIQRQIEQFQLKEPETHKFANHSLKDKETKPLKGMLKHTVKDNVKTQEKDHSKSNYSFSHQRVCSPTSLLKQTINVNASFPRSQSPENSLKPSDYAPTPASSPNSLSPGQSPSISPSPTSSPKLFSIRNCSGGLVKRGATITITPKRLGASGEGGGGGGTASTTVSTSTTSTPAMTPSQQTPGVGETVRKKFPLAEEIEVIGGYQNLEKSCLVKNKGISKKAKVCFDEEQLEQVCEYPSEASAMAAALHSQEARKQEDEEAQQEDADAGGLAITSRSTRNIGTSTVAGVRVGQYHPLLKKHKV